MNLLMIDNYDSFTFNIVQYFGELGARVSTLRNDETTLEDLQARFARGEFSRLCISPGPCAPAQAGVSVAAIRHLTRSEERRVGKECRSRWSPYH